jgi:class 3 adenylate cyclase
LGPQRGAEELTHYLNLVYDALIAELHRFGGSVINFNGDAITCWITNDNGLRAVACGLSMQQIMRLFGNLRTPSGKSVSLAVKAAVVVGEVSRYVVGNPEVQLIDVLAGTTLNRLVEAEHHAATGEVVIDETTADSLSHHVRIVKWRQAETAEPRFAVVDNVIGPVPVVPWPTLPSEA